MNEVGGIEFGFNMALEARLQQKFTALIPLFEISDAVIASVKSLLHAFSRTDD